MAEDREKPAKKAAGKGGESRKRTPGHEDYQELGKKGGRKVKELSDDAAERDAD